MASALSSRLEAVLFAAGEPLSRKRLMELLGASSENLTDALNALRIALTDRGLTVIEMGDMLELRTSPETADAIEALRKSELSRDLGKASLETLALILYKGSATRGEIDWVRGVNSSTAVRALLLRGLIERIEDASDKRRARYQATVDALAHLGVASPTELPRHTEFREALSTHEAKAESAVTADV